MIFDFEKLDLLKIKTSYNHSPILQKDIARVSEYEKDFSLFSPLTFKTRDLKDEQRPWTIRAILNHFTQGRILEIGAGNPFVAEILNRLGFEVWIVDPYDGSGGGTSELR